MTTTIDLSGLAPAQIEQLQAIAEAFRTTNKLKQPKDKDKVSDFDPTPLFFESDILQPFNRSLLYGQRT
ncbi:MAG: hypothetical protein AB4290_16105 [Spirulina sp.]